VATENTQEGSKKFAQKAELSRSERFPEGLDKSTR
jgi:hypothetical protein